MYSIAACGCAHTHMVLFVGSALESVLESAMDSSVGIGPATRCDAAYLRWGVLKPLRCIKISCDALRCIFQHVGNFSPDFGISQLPIVRFSNGFQQNDGHLIHFHVICDRSFSVKYF